MSIKPWLSIVGSIMFGLSSFFFISLSVGHNSKIMAMSFMPMIVGAFIYTYRKKAILGSILMALFLGLELMSNHIQITYYTFMILIPLGFSELIRFYKAKRMPSFFKTTGRKKRVKIARLPELSTWCPPQSKCDRSHRTS